MIISFCLPHPVAVSVFIICSGLYACTEMLCMGVLYVSFWSKVRPRTFGCGAMGSAGLSLHNIPSSGVLMKSIVCLRPDTIPGVNHRRAIQF